MKVINSVSWGGTDFSYVPGDVIDLPEVTARARIAAGLCRAMDFANVDSEEVKLPTTRTKMAQSTTATVVKSEAKPKLATTDPKKAE